MTTASGAVPGTPPRVDCTIDADGRTVFTLRAPATAASGGSPRLLLRLRPAKGQPEETTLAVDLTSLDEGRPRGVLESRTVLEEGRWDVFLVPDPSAPRVRLRPGLRDQRALVDGYTRDWPSPVAVRVPYTTVDGYLALRTWLRTAHAEVERIETTDRSMTVGARLHGASLSGSACVLLRRRDVTRLTREVPARVEGDGRRFLFTVDYAELAGDSPGGGVVWDVFARVRDGEGTAPVRVARLLDDVADRKEVFVHPVAVVGGAAVRPYYTVDNDLSVEVRAAVSP